MTIDEFRSKYKKKDESVMSLADLVTRRGISDDPEFEQAARDAVAAEDKFYVLMLERGLEQ